MVGVAALLEEARRAGLRVAPDGDRLVIRGPKTAERLARALLEHKREVLSLLPRDPSEAPREPRAETRQACGEAARIYSKFLDVELWIASDEEMAADLCREGVDLPILLPEEAEILAGMAEADARSLLGALAKIQRALPGARLRNAVRRGCDA